ncbi:MAG: helix-turn-helix transcriptional regulator [Oscillospiraceae bacterium]|nr:helix-turn-helix transcriptional regulator [Oscillospiraceae bacterium]
MTFGAKLQNLRKQTGMSQESLAERLNVSRQAVSRWEQNLSLPETENIINIAKIFDVSFDYLLNENIESTTSVERVAEKIIPVKKIADAFKRYGYIFGYIVAGFSLYCLVGYIITLFSVYKMSIPPQGFTLSGANGIFSSFYGILALYIVISTAGCIGGLAGAVFMKRKFSKGGGDK